MNYFDQHGMSYHITPRHILLPGGGSCLEVAVHHSGKSAKHHPNTRRRTYAHARTRKATSHGTLTKYHVHLPQCKHCEAGAGRTVAGISGNYPRSCLLPLDMERRTNIRGELKDLARIVKENNLTLTTMIVVGEAIGNREGLSRLYAHEFKHLYRK